MLRLRQSTHFLLQRKECGYFLDTFLLVLHFIFGVLSMEGIWRESNPEIIVIMFENVLLGFWLYMKKVLIAKRGSGCVLCY